MKIVNVVLLLIIAVMIYLGIQKKQQYEEMNALYNNTVQQNEALKIAIEEQATTISNAEVELQKVTEENAEQLEVYKKWEKYNQRLIDLLQ